MLPKGTLVPNSGNISSIMTRAQIIQTQNKYCGKSGVVYVTGSTGPTGYFNGTIKSLGPGTNLDIGNNLNTGILNICTNTNHVGAINIGTNASTTANGIYLGNLLQLRVI